MPAIHEIPLPENQGEFSLPIVVRVPLAAADLPQLHSNPTAPATLLLDFNGRTTAAWGSRTNAITPPFDYVNDLEIVTAIWKRVASDFSRFNIDVTTVDPGNETNRVTVVIAIGGAWSDWYGSASGGVAYVGGFYNLSSNVGFAFARSLGNNAKYIADVVSHEAGHLFGLQHQSLWQDGALVTHYRTDGPIMGAPYSHQSPYWTIGQTSNGNTQDDTAGLLNVLGPDPVTKPTPDEPMDAATKAAILSAVSSLRSVADTLAALTGTTTPDATRITAPNGTLTTPDGTVLSFGGPANGGYAILMNGVPPAGGGASIVLGVKDGVIYAFNDRSNWYKWTGASWQVLAYDPFA